MLNLSIGLMATGAATRAAVPVLVGFSNNSSGNPTLPTGVVAGDLLIAVGASTTALPGTPTDWTDWAPDAGTQTGTGAHARLVYKTAAGGDTISWTGAGNARPMWAFRNAARGVNSFVYAATGTASCAWPTLTLAEPSIVCVYSIKGGAQTDISVTEPDGGPWLATPNRVTKNTSAAALIRTTAGTRSSFAPSAETFDSGTGGHVLIAFSVVLA